MNAPGAPHAARAPSWIEQNQRWLSAEFARLRRSIDARLEPPAEGSQTTPEEPAQPASFVPALERCAALFGLSPFERELLLLCAGVELDRELRRSVERAHGTSADAREAAQPTFSLALGLLIAPHWDALSPQAPLRRFRLLELAGRRAPAWQPLFIDERVLHFITGVGAFDERLHGVARLETARLSDDATSDAATRIAHALGASGELLSLVALTHERGDWEALQSAARAGLARAETRGLWIRSRDLPEASQLAELSLLLDREAALSAAIPVLELEGSGDALGDHDQRALSLLAHSWSPALLLAPVAPSALSRLSTRRVVELRLAPEQRAGATAVSASSALLDRSLRAALRQFQLSAGAQRRVLERVEAELRAGEDEPSVARRVFQACREQARGGLDASSQRIDSKASFEDLVLPPAQLQLLREIPEHLKHRERVYDDWSIGGATTRGKGLCVLFAGESGTGKTLAAEAIANEAGLDLYRIDLSAVVSKYIGETEKNLKRVFDAAESSGAVLLFDEADALYGKRSEVKDSHDRYANVEVAYLLQRVESYRGLAVLTTNFRSAIDRAFLRRIRFIVQFPFPDDGAREQIWRRELPVSAVADDLDFAALARMKLSGGSIHGVALNAAFMAAAAGERIGMDHLRRAAQREAAKLERPLTDAGSKVWS